MLAKNNRISLLRSWKSVLVVQSLVPVSSVIGPHAALVLSWRQCVSGQNRCAEQRTGRSWRRMRAASPAIFTAEPPQGPDGNVNKSIWKILCPQKLKAGVFGVFFFFAPVRDAKKFIFSWHLYLLQTCFIVMYMCLCLWISLAFLVIYLFLNARERYIHEMKMVK